ncbi:MAG: hypothetical protein M0R03_04890 [Novosphingobium sp.]|nr:hypothetical protein [Novosphingobium sp.]
MRLHGAEDLLRNALREVLRADGSYAARRVIQAPAAAAVLLGFSAFAALFAARALRVSRGRRARAVNHAFLALAVMAGLIALRIVSFHPIDALLYRPLHLNWVIDIGATAAVVWSAHAYRAALARPAAV